MELRTISMLLFIAYFTSSAYGDIDCGCDYHKGGCAISIPAPKGFKCRCRNWYGLLTCSGSAFPCSNEENCAAWRSSYCACKLGGGNCGGYRGYNAGKDCSAENKASSSGSSVIHGGDEPDCDCSYHAGGCSIYEAAPKDNKCVCVYRGLWTCSGWAQGCSSKEHCPGGVYTYCGCRQGGGNCKGYPEYKTDPFGRRCSYSKPKPQQCNCNRNSDWTSSSYTVSNVQYQMNKMDKTNNRLEVIGIKDIPNASNSEQTIEFLISKSLESTTSFEHQGGIKLSIGGSFDVAIPFSNFTMDGEFAVEGSYNYKWGESKTISLGHSHNFICNGPKKTHTKCQVSVERSNVNVPYIMTLTHKSIPNCKCESAGVWHGVDAFNMRLMATSLGACNTMVNGKCQT